MYQGSPQGSAQAPPRGPPSGLPQGPAAVLPQALGREVVVIGICGASGSGKGALAKQLATALDTPYVLCTDFWFKPQQQVFPEGLSYEMPESVDWALFWKQVKGLVDRLRRADAGVMPEQQLLAPVGGLFASRLRPFHSTVLKPAAEGPVYIVLEGFKLFCAPDFVKNCDRLIWLEADCETCASRRATRPENQCPAESYRHYVWPEHINRKQMMLNAAFEHPSKYMVLENFRKDVSSLPVMVQAIVRSLRSDAAEVTMQESPRAVHNMLCSTECLRFGRSVDFRNGAVMLIDDP